MRPIAMKLEILFQISDPLPHFDDEFIMVVSDYMRESSKSILEKARIEASRLIFL